MQEHEELWKQAIFIYLLLGFELSKLAADDNNNDMNSHNNNNNNNNNSNTIFKAPFRPPKVT